MNNIYVTNLVNGGWGHWLQFSACSHTCGSGTKVRWRYCNSPRPSHGGQPCQGPEKDTQSCHVTNCVGPSPGIHFRLSVLKALIHDYGPLLVYVET